MAAFLFLYYWEDHREEAAGSEWMMDFLSGAALLKHGPKIKSKLQVN